MPRGAVLPQSDFTDASHDCQGRSKFMGRVSCEAPELLEGPLQPHEYSIEYNCQIGQFSIGCVDRESFVQPVTIYLRSPPGQILDRLQGFGRKHVTADARNY